MSRSLDKGYTLLEEEHTLALPEIYNSSSGVAPASRIGNLDAGDRFVRRNKLLRAASLNTHEQRLNALIKATNPNLHDK